MIKKRQLTGQTPLDDISGLIPAGIKTRNELNALEAENIRKSVIFYLAVKPTVWRSCNQKNIHFTA